MARLHRFPLLAVVSLLALGGLTASGCFNVDKPPCSYACADVEPRCPDSYECRNDGYCHLQGSIDTCLFSDAAMPADLSVALPSDMTVVDMTPGTD